MTARWLRLRQTGCCFSVSEQPGSNEIQIRYIDIVFGTFVLVLGTFILVLGTFVLVLGTIVLVLGTFVLVLGTWFFWDGFRNVGLRTLVLGHECCNLSLWNWVFKRKSWDVISWSWHFTHRTTYTDSQKHESTLLHTYILNEYLTADHSCTTIFFFLKNLL